MQQTRIPADKKKKIKAVLAMMNKQNERFIPVAPPLVEMMDQTTSEAELDFLIKMGTDLYPYEKAAAACGMPKSQFDPFFDELKRKGLVHVEFDSQEKEEYRINAIAVGWYEAMVHYMIGKPGEKQFSEKWNEFFLFFRKFNFAPLRNLQNLFLKGYTKPGQDAAIIHPELKPTDKKRKTIPINTAISSQGAAVFPTSHVNDIIDEYAKQDAIYAFPCVCRHGNKLIASPCGFDMPGESCIAFGAMAKSWAGYGYGRHVSKEEAVDILDAVREQGAVHSVIHERDDIRLPVVAICNCCWDCCGLLKSYNMGAVSLKYQSFYSARVKEDKNCKGCGLCEKYCPTTAMKIVDKIATCQTEKCIGCGQCAYQCPKNNIELYPNAREVYLPLLKKSEIRIAY